jgi:uncharacterized protein involved in propanediol utilization
MSVGTGRAFGTFGELVQGVLPDGDRDFLVTFPLDRWSRATFRYWEDSPELLVFPPDKRKARVVARASLDRLGLRGGGVLEIASELPEGKGMASSSADLVATTRAVADAVGTPLTVTTIESLLRDVEPSDGVMYDGVVAFYHREVRLHSELGSLPPLAVIGHDEGGQVDTILHNRKPKPFTAAEKDEFADLLAGVGAAIAAGDLGEIGRITTRSAVLNARIRLRHGLGELRALCSEVGGLGLVLAHSGTMLGILMDCEEQDLISVTEYVRRRCSSLGGRITLHRSLSGPLVSAGTRTVHEKGRIG